MIYVSKTFETRAEAESFRDSYLNSFHPCGYGTSLTITERDGQWHVNGSRYRSCD